MVLYIHQIIPVHLLKLGNYFQKNYIKEKSNIIYKMSSINYMIFKFVLIKFPFRL
jgi:hypothetical protein